jgi:hypothetical protein
MNKKILISISIIFIIPVVGFSLETPTYTVVDTGQKSYFSDKAYIKKPKYGNSYFGQDSNYLGNQSNYRNNQNGTITDNNTKLMWQKSISNKLTWQEAVSYANNSNLAGFSDWRIPTIKELYSLIDFRGKTGSGKIKSTQVPSDAKPYINTNYFDFEYSKENRYIDAQYWTKTDYTSTTMRGSKTFFGVNFADGRIKGYPKFNKGRGGSTSFYLRLVRGNKKYGINDFVNNGNKTIYDKATTLTWMKNDSKKGLDWNDSLSYCENLNYAGIDAWRLPNAKELQSIVDYTKSPSVTNSATINDLFNISTISNEANQKDYPSFWSSTTHLDGKDIGSHAVYLSFGRALGFMTNRRTNNKELMDVHGAGAQRSDPKSGNSSRFKDGRGPQGDVVRIKNYVRCVSDDFTKINKSNDYKIESSNKRQSLERRDSFAQNKESSNQKFEVKENNKGPISKFDKNADNKISYKEAPKMMKENFTRHDLNGDGFIDKDESRTLPRPRR